MTSTNRSFSITPLGGVDEIGSNCTLVETHHHQIFIDYGILFPYEDFFDINYLIADLDHLEPNKKEKVLYITHGHEDHIGAVAHIVKKFPKIKIYAPRVAKELIHLKLQRRGINHLVTEYTEQDVFEFDHLTFHPVHVTHSIPYTYGLVIEDTLAQQSVLFISDFKYDLNPLYEKPFNTKKIQSIFKRQNKNYAFLDSTNILNPERTPSERDLVKDLESLFSSNRRIFITLFASNIYRMKTLLKLCLKYKRKAYLVGRSLEMYKEIGKEVGILDQEDLQVINDLKSAKNLFQNKNVFFLTGSQGDFLGATRRVAQGEHSSLEVVKDDLFIFSSKAIPGNEKRIYRLYNDIVRSGGEVVTDRDLLIHASGHPCQKDLKDLYADIKPDFVFPIHGETLFLEKHKDFCINECSIDSTRIANSQTIHFLNDHTFRIEEGPSQPPVLIHGNDLVIAKEKISERRKLATQGLCLVCLDPEIAIELRGLPIEAEMLLPDLELLIERKINERPKSLNEEIRILTRRFYNEKLGYKPVTIVF